MPTQSPRKAFTSYLEQNSLKLTPQRITILEAFLAQDGHVSAEELYEAIKRSDPSIGQATVYRTVKLLAESGVAKPVDLGEGVIRYERDLGTSHHDHLICERCRRTMEIVDDEIEKLQERLAAEHGFTLTGHRMDLFGLCPECRKETSR